MPIVLNGTTGITTPTYNGNTTAEYLVPVTGFKNRIINGAMTIDQRNAGASVTPSVDGTYQIDRWQSTFIPTSKFSVQQSTTAPTGFRNSTLITSTSAYSVTGTDRLGWQQSIEGFNTADLMWGTANAQTVTLSFWVNCSLTGVIGGSLANSGNARAYPFSFTVNSANTWEYKTVTIAGDTTGTWGTTNGVGINVRFCLGAVASYRNTAGSWVAGDFWGPTGGINFVGTNGATFYITGVQLEVGSTATSFDYRPYGTELALCQRYFYRLNRTTGGDNTVAAGANSASHNLFVIKMPTELRAKPTITKTGTAFTVYSAGVNTVNPTFASSTAGTQQSRIIFTLTGTSGNSCWMDLDNDNTYFDFSSEL
jgi:hypothetical protein